MRERRGGRDEEEEHAAQHLGGREFQQSEAVILAVRREPSAQPMSAAPAPAAGFAGRAAAIALQRNRELAIRVYALRNECPVSAILGHLRIGAIFLTPLHPPQPDDAASQYSTKAEPPRARACSWEVYASLPGVDTLYTGVAKRTPSGGYFTS